MHVKKRPSFNYVYLFPKTRAGRNYLSDFINSSNHTDSNLSTSFCSTVLAKRGYLKEREFIHYLEYLQYWKQQEYAKFLKYVLFGVHELVPVCLLPFRLLPFRLLLVKKSGVLPTRQEVLENTSTCIYSVI